MFNIGLGDKIKAYEVAETQVITDYATETRVTVEKLEKIEGYIEQIDFHGTTNMFTLNDGKTLWQHNETLSVVEKLPFAIGTTVFADIYNDGVKDKEPRRSIVLDYFKDEIQIKFGNFKPIFVKAEQIKQAHEDVLKNYKFGTGPNLGCKNLKDGMNHYRITSIRMLNGTLNYEIGGYWKTASQIG